MATSDTDTLASLVARSQQGERAAVDALIHALQPDIYKLAQRFLMIPADAEDACQEILLKILTRLSQYDGRSLFSTWAYAVARNHLLDLKRRPFEQAMSFNEFAEDLAQGLSDQLAESAETALQLEEIRIGCTLAMLQCLDRDLRLSYILGEILELEHQTAADVLDISCDAYRKRLSRARSTVSNFMLGHCGLVNPNNACRCSKRVSQAIKLQRIDPAHLVFSSSTERTRKFPQLLAQIRSLEESQRAAALYRAQSQPEASADFVQWIRTTVVYRELAE